MWNHSLFSGETYAKALHWHSRRFLPGYYGNPRTKKLFALANSYVVDVSPVHKALVAYPKSGKSSAGYVAIVISDLTNDKADLTNETSVHIFLVKEHVHQLSVAQLTERGEVR